LSAVIDHYSDPVASIRHFEWDIRHPRYSDPLNLDTNSVNADNRERFLSPGLARKLDLTGVSLQMDLISKGVVNEISDCSPRPF
jgi:hypothetical protein